MLQDGMWIIFLEMFLVLALGAFIVWWTWPRRKKPEDRAQPAKDESDARR